MTKSTKEHWNAVYLSGSANQLGWYEGEPTLSLKLIDDCAIMKDDPILDVGAGATTLIDFLIQRDYRRITGLDISEAALVKLRERLGKEKASQVDWLVDDITNPTAVSEIGDIAIWHDRALLHFLTEEAQRQSYVSLLKKVVRVGGFVIIAAFAKDGTRKCSGLDVRRYDHESLAALLGDEFMLLAHMDYSYQMPSGATRPYVYVRFQRK